MSHLNSVDSLRALVRAGSELLARRDWAAAREQYDLAIRTDGRAAAAWEGAGIAARYLADLPRSLSALETAHLAYGREGDIAGAARAASEAALHHALWRGDAAMGDEWFGRAEALLADHPRSPECAWLAAWRAVVLMHERDEVTAARRYAAHALRLNADHRLPAVACLAEAVIGFALVREGEVEEGLRSLDVAVIRSSSNLQLRPEAVAYAWLAIFDACEHVRDLDRAQQVLDRGREVFAALDSPTLAREWDLREGSLAIWRGEYEQSHARLESLAAGKDLDSSAPVIRGAALRLAELRRRQGRGTEGTALLEPHGASPAAQLSMAWIRLDSGDLAGARAMADAYLESAADATRRVHGLDVLVRIAAAVGDKARLQSALGDLRYLTRRINTRLTRGVLAEAEAMAAVSPDVSRVFLEEAIDEYDLGGAPYEAANARISLAAALTASGRRDAGVRVLEVARTTAERIGAAGLLRRLSAEPLSHPDSNSALSAREREVLVLVAQGLSNQEIGDRLFVSPFTVKRHVANILTKLDLPSRAAAASYAVREGITT